MRQNLLGKDPFDFLCRIVRLDGMCRMRAFDVVFTSNFFEESLPDKAALGRTLDEIYPLPCSRWKTHRYGSEPRSYLPGEYWDFWDHQLPLTDRSLAEGLTSRGFQLDECLAKFLPYTMVNERAYPVAFLKLTSACP